MRSPTVVGTWNSVRCVHQSFCISLLHQYLPINHRRQNEHPADRLDPTWCPFQKHPKLNLNEKVLDLLPQKQHRLHEHQPIYETNLPPHLLVRKGWYCSTEVRITILNPLWPSKVYRLVRQNQSKTRYPHHEFYRLAAANGPPQGAESRIRFRSFQPKSFHPEFRIKR